MSGLQKTEEPDWSRAILGGIPARWLLLDSSHRVICPSSKRNRPTIITRRLHVVRWLYGCECVAIAEMGYPGRSHSFHSCVGLEWRGTFDNRDFRRSGWNSRPASCLFHIHGNKLLPCLSGRSPKAVSWHSELKRQFI